MIYTMKQCDICSKAIKQEPNAELMHQVSWEEGPNDCRADICDVCFKKKFTKLFKAYLSLPKPCTQPSWQVSFGTGTAGGASSWSNLPTQTITTAGNITNDTPIAIYETTDNG